MNNISYTMYVLFLSNKAFNDIRQENEDDIKKRIWDIICNVQWNKKNTKPKELVDDWEKAMDILYKYYRK